MRKVAKGAAGHSQVHRFLSPALVLLACLAFAPHPVFAENEASAQRKTLAQKSDPSLSEAESDPLSSGPFFAVISIADQRISLYGGGGLLARSSVSTGKRGHATPTGVFSIVQKRRWHTSNIYSGAEMPFMQRITWSGIALHAGVVPGYPASHGCIRLPPAFAQRLFKATAVGYRVIIAPSDTAPAQIVHAALPEPRLLPAPSVASSDAPETADAVVSSNPDEQNGGVTLEKASLQDMPIGESRLNPLDYAREMRSKANADAKAAGKATRSAKQLIGRTTIELRVATRKLAKAEDEANTASRALANAVRQIEDEQGREAIAEVREAKLEAEAALEQALAARTSRIAAASGVLAQADEALSDAQSRAKQLRLASMADTESQGEAVLDEAHTAEELRLAEAVKAKARAEAELIEVTKAEQERVAEATETVAHTEADLAEEQDAEQQRLAKAAEARTKAEAALAQAQSALAETRAEKDAAQTELAAARTAFTEAKAAGNAAQAALAEARRRVKPLSVFISRKTGRLYVRQDFEPLFDAPIAIRDADREIGTHVYVSTHAAENGSQLHWQASSMPAGQARSRDSDAKTKGKKSKNGLIEAAATLSPARETPQGALDRVTIPEDVSRRLAELTWVGATIVISDHGISGETGATTDFIILTR